MSNKLKVSITEAKHIHATTSILPALDGFKTRYMREDIWNKVHNHAISQGFIHRWHPSDQGINYYYKP